MDRKKKSRSDGKEREKCQRNSVKRRDIIAFSTQLKAIHKSSTLTRNRSKDTKGVTHSHLPRMKREKKDENTFSSVSRLL